MEKENKKTTEIPFGAKDSELYKFEYTIPEGYEARIEDGKVIVKKKESEDERIRKGLLEIFNKAQFGEWGKLKIKDIIAWLERQKEQKPAEWSDEDRTTIERIVETIQDYAMETGQIDEVTCGTKEPLITYIRFLRSLRPQPHWKPSEEQMKAMALVNDYHVFASTKNRAAIKSLYEDLKKL